MREILLGLVVLNFSQAHAARPFVTDDARLTTSKSCQVESWSRLYKNSTEIWALPACNTTGNFEVTAGMGLAKPKDTATTQDYVIQAKSLARELATNDWGWGFALGRVNHPDITSGPKLQGNTYAYIPISISSMNDRVVFHVNMGWVKENTTQENLKTFGLGTEIQASNRFLMIAETFGDNKSSPYWQTGFRYSIIPNFFQIDTTIGRQISGDLNTRWISFGLRYTPSSLF
jgi:hypothetical protein